MTVTQTLMDIGSWSLQLKPQTPGAIVDLFVDWYSLLTITAQRVPLRTVAATDRPLYRGIYLGRDNPYALNGAGVEWYCGSPSEEITQTDGFGPLFAKLWSSATVATALGDVTTKNGLSANVLSVTGTITGGLTGTTRTALDAVICKQTSSEWRVRPDCVVEIYRAVDATATPVALITSDPGGREPGSDLLAWHLSEIDPDLSVDDLRNRMLVYYNGGTSSVNTGAPSDSRKAYGGGQLEICGFDSVDSTTSGDATSRAGYLLGLKNGTIRSLTVHVDDYLPHSQLAEPDLIVGAAVSVYDPELGLYDLTGRPVVWRGSHVWPVNLRCTEITWPITSGSGVYLDNTHQGGQVHDISEYVVFDSDGVSGSDTVLTLGAPPRWWTGARRPIAAA